MEKKKQDFAFDEDKGLKFLYIFFCFVLFSVSSKGTQSLKSSAAVETATCYYVVSILITLYSNFYHSALSHHECITQII